MLDTTWDAGCLLTATPASYSESDGVWHWLLCCATWPAANSTVRPNTETCIQPGLLSTSRLSKADHQLCGLLSMRAAVLSLALSVNTTHHHHYAHTVSTHSRTTLCCLFTHVMLNNNLFPTPPTTTTHTPPCAVCTHRNPLQCFVVVQQHSYSLHHPHTTLRCLHTPPTTRCVTGSCPSTAATSCQPSWTCCVATMLLATLLGGECCWSTPCCLV